MAYPQAVSIVKACVDTAMQLGCRRPSLPLAQAAILLATAPKSNSVTAGIGRAGADVRAGRTGTCPGNCRTFTRTPPVWEREAGLTCTPTTFPATGTAAVSARCLKGVHYYEYGDNKTEQAAKHYWDEIKGPQP